MKPRYAIALAAAALALSLAPPVAAQQPTDEERIAQARAGLAVLDHYAVRPACDQIADPSLGGSSTSRSGLREAYRRLGVIAQA